MNNYCFSFDPFRRERTRSNGRATAKGLEFGVDDLSVSVNFDLDFIKIKLIFLTSQCKMLGVGSINAAE